MVSEFAMVIVDELNEPVRFCNELSDCEIEDILLNHPEYTISLVSMTKGGCYD